MISYNLLSITCIVLKLIIIYNLLYSSSYKGYEVLIIIIIFIIISYIQSKCDNILQEYYKQNINEEKRKKENNDKDS